MLIKKPYYMAPEVVFSDHMHCNEKVDVWSVGVIFYYLFFKKKPFKGIFFYINKKKC